MANTLTANAVLTLVKNKLNSERTKLWLPPYSDEEGNRAEFTNDLISRYAQELKVPRTEIERAVENLRTSSIERLSARNRFVVTGVAALKVKVAKKHSDKSSNSESKESFVIDVKLDESGLELRRLIGQHCNVEADRLKLISAGRLIRDDASLQEQGMSVTSTVMAIALSKSVSSVIQDERAASSVQKTREDAEIIANQTIADEDEYKGLMQIADQNGRIIKIPKDERKALGLAMLLNEKGKAALRRKEYSEALLLLLEADKEFRKCSAGILKTVDNYALLCLDITWCYLCLQSIEDLPDAEARLQTCEECLLKSYGSNLERLKALKGTTDNESALLVRLKLLKGIVAFYRRQWKIAATLFTEVNEELMYLKVDDEKLSEVMALGYSALEARLGLRSGRGNVELAVNYILNKRKEKEDIYKKEKEERQKRKEARKYGKTANGELLNVDYLQTLVAMGYSQDAAVRALRQANNNMSLAVQIIQDHPELLTFAGPSTEESLNISDELVAQVASCGFDYAVARNALKKHKGQVNAAIDDLIANEGFIEDAMDNATSPESSIDEEQQQWLAEQEALERLRSDIPEDESAHLDITLEEESAFLAEYRLLMSHVQH